MCICHKGEDRKRGYVRYKVAIVRYTQITNQTIFLGQLLTIETKRQQQQQCEGEYGMVQAFLQEKINSASVF
jgi:hypothetical protein